jgi:ADP-ribose pyrophosphatase YjhB (NUDIX family)
MRPIVGVGAVILQDGKIILVKRRAEPGKDRWSIPGGSVHLSEKVRDAAIREAKEESGLDIEIVDDRPLDVFDSIVSDDNGRTKYHFTLLEFLAKPKGGSLQAAEDAADARWVALDDVKNYDLTSSFRTFFEKHEAVLRRLSSSQSSR